MKIARIAPGIAVLNGRIFVCGGEVDSQILANGEVSFPLPGEISKQIPCDFVYTSGQLQVYDPHEDKWTEMASMCIPRCEFGMCALDGYVYAFGGWVGMDIGGTIER